MTLNCRGRLLDLSHPLVMGILNVTPDSFFDGGRYSENHPALAQVQKMLADGAAIIDIGGVSTRPGAADVPEQEELRRVVTAVESVAKEFPEIVISVDTWRSSVATAAVNAGASMINDISAGRFDHSLFETVAALDVPYVLMHMKGSPQDMQHNPHYEYLIDEVLDFFIERLEKLKMLGIKDIVLDPGFGFGKKVEHNFQLLNNLSVFKNALGLPVLAGISRKSMICKVLKVSPENALNGTTALHMAALQQGANILRVHDVREAVEVIRLWEMLEAV